MPEQSLLNGHIQFDPHTGTLSVSFPHAEGTHEPWTALRGARAIVHYRLDDTPHRLELTGPGVGFGLGENLVTFSHHDDQLGLDWSWISEGSVLETWLEVSNLSDTPVALDRLDVLHLTGTASIDLPGPIADWRVYLNGWQSWAPSGVRRVGDGPFPAPGHEEYRLKNLPHGDGLRSEWVTVVSATARQEECTAPDSEAPNATSPLDSAHLLIGFVTAADQLADLILDADDQLHSLTASCYTDGIFLDPGHSLRSERLRVATGPDGWESLKAWAGRLGELMRARVPQKTPTGWCTWYYYYGLNTAQDVYISLNAFRRHHLPLNLVMIDDGFQAAIGDWSTLNRDRFNDMSSVAATIRREGRVPGIWTAPFGLAADSQTWASHPDWVVRDVAGEPVLAWRHFGNAIYALDTTHPDVSDWLHDLFSTMRRDWGYDAFKVDFLFAAALTGRRYDPQSTRAQALRRGLEVIRDAIGEDAFMLGCGAPLGPAVGLVDGMRIGPDVSPSWEPVSPSDLAAPGAANAVRNSLARAFTHRRLWATDSDCLLVRPRGDSSQMTLNETRTLATVLALTGGMLINGDQVGNLPPSRLAMLRQTLPPTEQVAHPLDLFQRDQPEVLTQRVERPWGRWWLVALINWDDRTRSTKLEPTAMGMPPGNYHVYDQWRADYLGQTDGPLSLPRHRPHETFLLLFKPVADRPDWLTSTFHLAAGSVEVVDVTRQKLSERRHKLIVHLEQRGENFGRLVFTVPRPWVVLDAQVNGRRRSVNVRDREAALIDMGFTVHDRAWVLVDFASL